MTPHSSIERTSRRDLKLTLILTAVLAVPLFIALAYLWNPHGDLGSETLAVVGLVGLFPYLYIASEMRVTLGHVAIPLAVGAQLCWFAIWVYCALLSFRGVRYLTTDSR